MVEGWFFVMFWCLKRFEFVLYARSADLGVAGKYVLVFEVLYLVLEDTFR